MAKCVFGRAEIQLLGYWKSSTGVRIDYGRFTSLKEWHRPHTGKQVMALMGTFNYVRDLIPNYAHLAAPLERLRYVPHITDELWAADPSFQASYDALKEALLQAPILTTPDFSKPFYVGTNASNHGL